MYTCRIRGNVSLGKSVARAHTQAHACVHTRTYPLCIVSHIVVFLMQEASLL